MYKRQVLTTLVLGISAFRFEDNWLDKIVAKFETYYRAYPCLLYTSDAADERSSVDLGGRRIIKKKNKDKLEGCKRHTQNSTNIIHTRITYQRTKKKNRR